MKHRRPSLTVAALVGTLLLAGCGTGVLPAQLEMPAGSRQWIIRVENQSDQDARLFVAEDQSPMGDLVGNANPATVPPRTTTDVRFTVPPGEGWAIFVNPTAERGPLLIEADVPPDVAGRLPIGFVVDKNGDIFMGTEGNLPGWFGN